MVLNKFGEAVQIKNSDLHSHDSVFSDPDIAARFQKFAGELKRIAPKAKDFIYFSAVMMHAAEASLINSDGSPKLTIKGEPITARWEQNGESLKWTSNDPNLKPYKNCFIPGTQILMSDGSSKNIEDIVPGDEVITHKNRAKKVLRTFETPYNGEMLEIKSKNNMKITCTPEHPFYHVDMDDFYKKGLAVLTERKRNNKNYKEEYKFSEAKNLKKGDLLTSPVVKTYIDSTLTPDRCRLLGLFAAEGSYAKKYGKLQAAVFTFGRKEVYLVDLVKELFAREFPECSVKVQDEQERSTTTVTATGYNISYFFHKHTNEYSHEKKLSKELVFSNEECKKNFLMGWLEGDGCLTDGNKLIGISVSPHLAFQVRTMLNSLNIQNSLRKNEICKRKINEKYKEYSCRPSYRVEVYSVSDEKFGVSSPKYTFKQKSTLIRNQFTDNYCLHYIRSIEKVNYTGKVYNFEVEGDNSYVASGLITHNCNGDIFPESELLKAYKNWVGKPLCVDHRSSSVDAIRGIILDTYYDRVGKRIVALCALDKINYPDLARKVETGYSTSVSMGTAVGKAICSDCGRVARTEKDFCQHMLTKSCYGEINLDLQPIELSIVVNGADPQAKIKQVLAAANNLNTYLENKEQEFNKLSSNDLQKEKIDSLEQDLKEATAKLEELKTVMEESSEEISRPYGQTSGTYNTEEILNNEPDLNIPQKFAEYQKFSVQIGNLKESLENRLQNMEKILQNLANKQEETMSSVKGDFNKEAYFQGAGGENEPTPGKPKYPADPMNENLRSQDKHMVGQMDTGPVDGMHPGVDSAGTSEEERKKMLARAEKEQRDTRRKEALQKAKDNLMSHKEAYFQGGGGVNEPAPGKVKYPVDKMNDNLREDSDKQMVGQKPFPNVGPVDGMHPGPDSVKEDELKRKQMLSRATLKAKFVKAANTDGTEDIDNSAWQVFVGDKLALTASVKEISGGRSEVLYDSIATKDFGSKMLEKIRSVGVEKVAEIYKKSQVMPGGLGSNPVEPSNMGAESPVPAGMVPAAPAVPAQLPEDAGQEMTEAVGDSKDAIKEVVSKLDTDVSDLKELVEALDSEATDAAMTEEVVSDKTASLQTMRKNLRSAILDGAKTAIAELEGHKEELELASSILDNKDSSLEPLVQDAVKDANAAIADVMNIKKAFIQYVEGTKELTKTAQEMKDMMANDKDLMGKDVNMGSDAELDALLKDDEDMADETADELTDLEKMELGLDDSSADDMNMADTVKVKMPGKEEVEVPVGSVVSASKEFDRTTKEGRAAYRAKLAGEFSGMLDEAHPKGGETTDLDVKPSGDLAKVEDLEEQHKKVMDVATAPPKVRKDAERLNQLISEGKVAVDELDSLVAKGLDSETVKYWKQFYGQAGSEGSQFASELVKQHAKAKFEAEVSSYKVKIARAYELTYDMLRRGFIADDRSAITAQVEEVMGWNDEAFESMKKVIAKQTPKSLKKEAGVPQVSGEAFFDDAPRKSAESGDFASELSRAFSNRRY